MQSDESRKVLIVGAGPAGGALAQILRKNDIPYEIFERETDLNARRGNGFSLDDAIGYLDEMMPEDLGDVAMFSSNHGTGDLDAFAWVDGLKGQIVARYESSPRGQPGFFISAVRREFRAWIVQHLPLQLGKKFTHYEEDDAGVTAYFNDGTSSRGALLVGADGARSLVRRQVLDEAPLELNSFVPIGGDVVLPRKALEAVREIASAGLVVKSPQTQMGFSQLEIKQDKSEARWWWNIAFRSDDPAADTAWVQAANPQSLYKKALASITHFPEIIQDAVRRGGPDGIWRPQIRFSEWVPPKSGLPRGRVTLIGDAAHNTAPFGGMGANTSIIDACELGKLLVDQPWATFGDLEILLKRYEKTMIPRGRATVLNARNSAIVKPDVKQSVRRGFQYIDPIQLEMPMDNSKEVAPPVK